MGLVVRQSFKNLIIIYAGIAIGYINAVILYPLILNEAQIGLIRLLLNVSLMFSTFAALGTVNISAKFFPYFNNFQKRHNGFLFFLIALGMIGFSILTLLLIIFNNFISSIYISKAPLLVDYYYYFIPFTFVFLFFNIFQSYIILNKLPVAPNLIKEVLIRILTITALLVYFINWINFNGLVKIIVLIYIISLVVLMIYVNQKKLLFLKPTFRVFRSKYFKEITVYGGFALLGGASGILISNIDGVMLSGYKGLGAFGVYTIAFLIATVVEIPKRSLSQSVVPLITEYNKNNNFKLLNELYKKTSITQLIMGSLIFMGIWCNINNIFHLIPHGNIYMEGKWVVFYIGLGKLFDLATGCNYEILSTSKYYKYDLTFMIMLGVIAVLTNMIFIPLYGITGAALASAISVFLFNLFRYIFIFIKMKLQPFTSKTLLELLGIGVALFINYLLPVQANFIIDIVLRSVIILIFFVSFTLIFKVSKDFNSVFNMLIKKIKLSLIK